MDKHEIWTEIIHESKEKDLIVEVLRIIKRLNETKLFPEYKFDFHGSYHFDGELYWSVYFYGRYKGNQCCHTLTKNELVINPEQAMMTVCEYYKGKLMDYRQHDKKVD